MSVLKFFNIMYESVKCYLRWKKMIFESFVFEA